MRLLRSLMRRLESMTAKEAFNAELSEELQFHLAHAVEENMSRGMTKDEALRVAGHSFGSVAVITEDSYRARRTAWFDDLKQDVRYGLRTLARQKGFSVLTILTLAIGIGACTAIFSLVDAVLLHSLPYGDPARLVYLFTPSAQLLHANVPPEVFNPSFADFFDLKKQTRSLSAMTLFQQTSLNLSAGNRASRIGTARVDADFFRTLQVQPEFGRGVDSKDEQPGSSHVVVISHALWQEMFAGRNDIVGKQLKLDGENYQVIGVMPRGFEYPHESDLPAVYGNMDRT